MALLSSLKIKKILSGTKSPSKYPFQGIRGRLNSIRRYGLKLPFAFTVPLPLSTNLESVVHNATIVEALCASSHHTMEWGAYLCMWSLGAQTNFSCLMTACFIDLWNHGIDGRVRDADISVTQRAGLTVSIVSFDDTTGTISKSIRSCHRITHC